MGHENSCSKEAASEQADELGQALKESSVHRIAQPSLHHFAVRKLDVERRLEPRHAARQPEVVEGRRAPITGTPEKIRGLLAAALKRPEKMNDKMGT